MGSAFSVLLEYNLALNDNSTDIYGEGKGYLNFGVRWSIADGVTVGFDLRDLLENRKWNANSADRALMIEFTQKSKLFDVLILVQDSLLKYTLH